jgi:AcrR family transcriptional regulator
MNRADDHPRGRRARLPAAERRETILRAAAEVFARAGYRATKVSEVAALVGVSEPVVFQNFGSKAALFAAVVQRAAAEVAASLDGLAETPGSASGLLAHVLSQAGREESAPGTAAAHRDGRHPGAAYGVLFSDAIALAAEPELSVTATQALQAVAAHLAALIRHAQAGGGVASDTNPDAAAWLLLSVLSAARLRTAAMPAGLEPAVTALALRALQPPSRP